MKHTSIKSKVLGSPTKQFLSKNGNDAQLTLVTAVYTIIKAKKIYKLSKHVQQTITNPYSGQMLSHAFTIKSRRSNTFFKLYKIERTTSSETCPFHDRNHYKIKMEGGSPVLASLSKIEKQRAQYWGQKTMLT